MFVDPYIATVTVFAGNFAPVSWMLCQGQLLAINDYTALFSLIGTSYGGDGQTTFALPDLKGRKIVSQGQGTGLPNYILGQSFGNEQTTLTLANLPAHNHPIIALTGTPQGSTDTTGVSVPSSTTVPAAGAVLYGDPEGLAMGAYSGAGVTAVSGGSIPVPTLVPYLAMNYIIAVEGIYPSRN